MLSGSHGITVPQQVLQFAGDGDDLKMQKTANRPV
jgi:hypothetical protein